jgi:hypothetical protein
MRKNIFFILVLLFPALLPATSGAETLTLTTYYPAPYGGYVSILTTGRTELARDGDYVTIGKAGNRSDKLAVNGNITATNNIVAANVVSGGNVLAGGKPVVTTVVCGFPMRCTITNNTLFIGIGATECSAPEPACGQTTRGVDLAGKTCTKLSTQECRYQCPAKANRTGSAVCPQDNFGPSTCYAQVQAAGTCQWFEVSSGIPSRNTDKAGCSFVKHTEECAPLSDQAE